MGRVADLDVGSYEAPDEAEFQFHLFSVAARRDTIRFTLDAALPLPTGRLGELCLSDLYGARYQTESCFMGSEALASGGFRHTFESQGDAELRAPAPLRHGAGGLAAALPLDALNEDDRKGA